MPSFSQCTSANEAAIAQLFNANALGFQFPAPNEFPNPKAKNVQVLSQDFQTTVTQIRDRWNLDRSESARRVYLDAFLHEAVKRATVSAIITIEESVSAGGFNGAIDYVVSAIDAQSQALIYQPSLVLEAKKGLNVDAQKWQLLAELGALRAAVPAAQVPYCRGALSDGRHWCFVSVDTTLPRASSHLTVQVSKVFDTGADGANALPVLGVLAYWLEKYNETTDSLFG